jgi:hypothetical protein
MEMVGVPPGGRNGAAHDHSTAGGQDGHSRLPARQLQSPMTDQETIPNLRIVVNALEPIGKRNSRKFSKVHSQIKVTLKAEKTDEFFCQTSYPLELESLNF